MNFYKIIRSDYFRNDILVHTVYFNGSKVKVVHTMNGYRIKDTALVLQPIFDNKTDKLIGFTD